MKKYEKEFVLQQEQEAQLEDPVERLQVLRERCIPTLAYLPTKQKFGFIKRVDKGWITTVKDLESCPFEPFVRASLNSFDKTKFLFTLPPKQYHSFLRN